jgi:toxin ParE1/3/4
MRRGIVRPEAYGDLTSAHDWYESRRAGLGAELAGAVLQKLHAVRLNPELFPVRHGPNTRRVLVDRFPYAVYFTTSEEAVIVLAIFHTSQDHPPRLDKRI